MEVETQLVSNAGGVKEEDHFETHFNAPMKISKLRISWNYILKRPDRWWYETRL